MIVETSNAPGNPEIERELLTDPSSPWFDADWGASGSGYHESPDEAIDRAAEEWAKFRAEQAKESFVESGSDLDAMDAHVTAEHDRLLARLPADGWVYIGRQHEWFGKGRESRWFVSVYPMPAGTPGSFCGSGSHADSLTAAGDAALADLSTKAAAALASASATAALASATATAAMAQSLTAPVAVVAAEERAA